MADTQTTSRRKPERTGALVRSGLTATPLPTVKLDPRPVYDFLFSAAECGEADELLPEDRAWLAEGRAALSELVGSECATCSGFATELGRLFVQRPDIKTARDLVAAVDALDDGQLLEILMGELIDSATESPEASALARRALDGDAAAYDELRRQLAGHKGHEVAPASLSELAPSLRAVVHAWLPRFQAVEARVVRMIERDIADRNTADMAGDPLHFVESTTNGIRLVPGPDIHRIVLAPTYFGRPYNSLARIGDVQLVCYPIADSALGAAGLTTPPVATVRLYRALGDETRLRILRLLADQDRYLTELATELELSKPTISHHLAQLRSAGLVVTTEQGAMTYYSLHRDRIAEAGPELAAFLAR
jgi:DNA-binding transcriptional ArsR family regulator